MTGARPYLLIVLVGVVLYAPSAFFGLSYLDDNILTVDNREFLSSFSNVGKAFTQDVFHSLGEYDAAYRPLLTVSFMVDAKIDRFLGVGCRISNIAFHCIASCLVFLLFVRLRYARAVALLFGLVFTVHPALVQAVAWIPGRNDSLLAIFVLAGFISFLEYIENRRSPYLVCHVVFFLAALFTKESAIVLPLACLGWCMCVRHDKPVLSGRWRLFAFWSCAIALWFAFRVCALSGNPVALSPAAVARDLAHGGIALISYIGKVLFPFNLSPVPTIEDMNMVYGAAAIAVITAGLILSKVRRMDRVIFGALWFLLFLVPTFVRPAAGAQAIFLESRLYLPAIGMCIVLGEIDVIKNIAATRGRVAAGVAVLGAFFIMSALHERDFRDARAFWECAAARSPHSSMAQYNLGWVYDTQGDLDKAERRYLRALELNPRQRYAHNGLGTVYERKGMYDRAEAEYVKEMKNTPYYAAAYRNLAELYRRQGRDVSAFKKAVSQ